MKIWKKISSVIFNIKWHTRKRKALAQFNKEELFIVKPLIENQLAYLKSIDHPSQQTLFGAGVDLNKILFNSAVKVCKRILTFRQIVGVQSMTGPCGLIFKLMFKEQQAGQLSLEVVRAAVEATTRKLQARWSNGAMQDLLIQHEIDIDKEITEALGAEVSYEIFNEILKDLFTLGEENFQVVERDDLESEQIYFDRIILAINKACNDIAFKTRRGVGNFIIVPVHFLSYLEGFQDSICNFTKADQKQNWLEPFAFVGILNHSIKVYTSLEITDDSILIGYKGTNGETDAGYFYAPYVPFMSLGVVVDPISFHPNICLGTRHGKHADRKSSSYYGIVKYTSVIPTSDATDAEHQEI